MILVYKLQNYEYTLVATVDEETAHVFGSSPFADMLRSVIEKIDNTDYNADHPDVMSAFRDRLESTYNNGYHQII